MSEKRISLTILHISDLHFGVFNDFEGEEAVFEECCGTINEKVNELLKDIGKTQADLLLITGDIGSTGIEDDY